MNTGFEATAATVFIGIRLRIAPAQWRDGHSGGTATRAMRY